MLRRGENHSAKHERARLELNLSTSRGPPSIIVPSLGTISQYLPALFLLTFDNVRSSPNVSRPECFNYPYNVTGNSLAIAANYRTVDHAMPVVSNGRTRPGGPVTRGYWDALESQITRRPPFHVFPQDTSQTITLQWLSSSLTQQPAANAATEWKKSLKKFATSLFQGAVLQIVIHQHPSLLFPKRRPYDQVIAESCNLPPTQNTVAFVSLLLQSWNMQHPIGPLQLPPGDSASHPQQVGNLKPTYVSDPHGFPFAQPKRLR